VVLANAYDVAHLLVGPAKGFCAGGSVWVWDCSDPAPGGSWHAFGLPAIDPNAALYLFPPKIDALRHEAEVLLNSFPATERRLEDLGCEHIELVHHKIETPGDVLMWACSIFNACTPLPDGWRAGYSDQQVRGARDWPWQVFSTAQQVADNFVVTHVTDRGRIAVLPVEEKCAVVYWTEPDSWYDTEVQKMASKNMDMVLPPQHPVTVAAYHG
jgi:hypothetical protein